MEVVETVDNEIVEITSDLSSFDSEDDEDNYSQVDLSMTHNNNGSLIEQQVLSTQQVFQMMERQMKKVMDVTAVSKPRIEPWWTLNGTNFHLPALSQQSSIASKWFQMGH